MIWLSNSALLYAAKVCEEIPNYSIIVFIERGRETDDVQKKLRTFTKNQHVRLFNTAFNWHVDYENGSKIKVITVGENARGNRCNLAVVSRGVDQQIIDEVVRPVETLNDPNPHTNETRHANEIQTEITGFADGGLINQDVFIALNDIANIHVDTTTAGWVPGTIENFATAATATGAATINTGAITGAITTNIMNDAMNDAFHDLGNAIRNLEERITAIGG